MSSEQRGILYLIPNTLGDVSPESAIPATALEQTRRLDYFVAENPKTARAFLKRIGASTPIQQIQIERLDHNTAANDIDALLDLLLAGRDAGLLSEAGLPALADPGANLIRKAHALGIRVIPLSGPSSIALAISASGLNGQRFAFHGYLPVEQAQLAAKLKELERESLRHDQTQIFIETPYRNDRTLAVALQTLAPETLLSIAADITSFGVDRDPDDA